MLLNGDLPTEDFHLISSCPCWAYTNASRGTINAWRFQSHWAAVVAVVVFGFSVMRCQPLRRAL